MIMPNTSTELIVWFSTVQICLNSSAENVRFEMNDTISTYEIFLPHSPTIIGMS